MQLVFQINHNNEKEREKGISCSINKHSADNIGNERIQIQVTEQEDWQAKYKFEYGREL